MEQRILKFRAWDTIDSEWKYSGHPHMPMWKFWENVELGGGYENVCQWTGLTDKNGKEVYDGDILKNLKHGGQLIEVFWEGIKDKHMGWLDFGGWSFRKLPGDDNMRYATYSGDIEVVGNIYENPELLKEASEQ